MFGLDDTIQMGIHTSFKVKNQDNRKSQIGIQFTGDAFGEDAVKPIISDKAAISYWMYAKSDIEDYFDVDNTNPTLPAHIFAHTHAIVMDNEMFKTLLKPDRLFDRTAEYYDNTQTN